VIHSCHTDVVCLLMDLSALCSVFSELHLVYATLRVFPYIFKSICLNSNILFSFLNLGKICLMYDIYFVCVCVCVNIERLMSNIELMANVVHRMHL